jgi:hypothetical protein
MTYCFCSVINSELLPLVAGAMFANCCIDQSAQRKMIEWAEGRGQHTLSQFTSQSFCLRNMSSQDRLHVPMLTVAKHTEHIKCYPLCYIMCKKDVV